MMMCPATEKCVRCLLHLICSHSKEHLYTRSPTCPQHPGVWNEAFNSPGSRERARRDVNPTVQEQAGGTLGILEWRQRGRKPTCFFPPGPFAHVSNHFWASNRISWNAPKCCVLCALGSIAIVVVSWRGEIRTAVSWQWRLSPDKWNVDWNPLREQFNVHKVGDSSCQNEKGNPMSTATCSYCNSSSSVLRGNLEFKRRQPCLEGSCQLTFQRKGDAEPSKTRLCLALFPETKAPGWKPAFRGQSLLWPYFHPCFSTWICSPKTDRFGRKEQGQGQKSVNSRLQVGRRPVPAYRSSHFSKL